MKHRSAQKKIQKKRKLINRGNKKVIYRVISIVLLLFVSTLFLGGFFTLQHLNKSFASALASDNLHYSVESEDFPTLIYAVVKDIKSDPIEISDLKYLIFDRNGGKVVSYSIPVGQKFDISGKFGEEELSKTLALSALNSSDPFGDGGKILKNTTLKIFGFKVDRVLIVDRAESRLFDDLLGNGSFLDFIRLKDVFNIREYFKTDLSLAEFYSLFSFVKSLPNDRIVSKTLVSSDFENSSAIDASYEDMGLDSAIAQEAKSISILNGTNTPGIASLGARVVNNVGGRIVASGNADKAYNTSVIVSDDPNSETCKFLSRAFHITNIVSKSSGAIQEHEVDRSDIVVIIGFDTSDRLY